MCFLNVLKEGFASSSTYQRGDIAQWNCLYPFFHQMSERTHTLFLSKAEGWGCFISLSLSFSTHTHQITLYFCITSVIRHADMLYHGVTGCNWCTTGLFFTDVQRHRLLSLQASHLLELNVITRQIIHSSVFSLHFEQHISDGTGSCWWPLYEKPYLLLHCSRIRSLLTKQIYLLV